MRNSRIVLPLWGYRNDLCFPGFILPISLNISLEIQQFYTHSWRGEMFQFTNKFNYNSNSWGFPSFMEWSEILNVDKGFIRGDRVVVEAHITVQKVVGVRCAVVLRKSLLDLKDANFCLFQFFNPLFVFFNSCFILFFNPDFILFIVLRDVNRYLMILLLHFCAFYGLIMEWSAGGRGGGVGASLVVYCLSIFKHQFPQPP